MFLVGFRKEGFLVRIQLVHARKVLVSHAYYDNGEGEAGATHILIDSLLHVVDDAIGEQQEDEVLLVCLGDTLRVRIVHHHLHTLTEVCWPIEVDIHDAVAVGLDDSL